MRTLSKTRTASFFTDPSTGPAKFRESWLSWLECQNYSPSCADHILYAILRGKDYRKACTPITNKNKLANGGVHDWEPRKAINELRGKRFDFKRFGGLFVFDIADQIAALLPPMRTPYGDPADACILGEYLDQVAPAEVAA